MTLPARFAIVNPRSLLVAAGCLAAILCPLRAEVPASSPSPTPDAGLQALPQTPDASPAPAPAPTPAAEVSPTPTPAKRTPTTEPGDPTLNTSNSFWLDNYPLNDLYQYLARQADFQYFQNPNAAMDHQLHRLALEILPISSGHLTVLHACAHFTLSSRVRQIGGGSPYVVRHVWQRLEPSLTSLRFTESGARL